MIGICTVTQWIDRCRDWLKKFAFRSLGSQCDWCGNSFHSEHLKDGFSAKWCAECMALFDQQPRCETCGCELAYTQRHCGFCLTEPVPWDRLYCIGEYRAPLSKYVQKLKYNRQFWHVRELTVMLSNRIDEPAPILLSIPLHWRRRLFRGFNQSDYLARYLVTSLQKQRSVTYWSGALKRVKVTRNQLGLNRKQRLVNLKGAFIINTHYIEKLKNKPHIAIIDDVVTTGSTMREICQQLRKIGVQRIDVYCICRASKPLK
jgi:ComF family protein